MNVLFITHYTGLYGANKSLLEVIINMKKLFCINPIVITPGVGDFNIELTKNNIENYIFNYYQWVTGSNSKFKNIIKYIRYKCVNYINLHIILKKLKHKNIEIVHSNSSVIDIGAHIAKKMKVKHIWHLREFGKEDYNLKYYYGISKSSKFMNDNSHKVIFISNALMAKYTDFIDKSKCKLIYNGINEKNYFIDIKNKNFNKEFNIVFTGLITPNKNQIELIKAMDILINIKKYKINAYFLGDGDTEYLEKLKNMSKDLNLQKNIFFEGRVENVKEYIKNSHVGVICSKNEAFGRVTVEYMMGGLTVIASNTGANAEIIDNNKNGLIYQLGNYKELSEKIEELYNNREKLKQLSINGQEKVINKFTSDINCKNIYKLYKEM